MNLETSHRSRSPSEEDALDETKRIPLHDRQKPAIAGAPPARTPADSVSEAIQSLMEITRDGEKGYLQAAQHVQDRGLRDEFNKFARERRSIVAELQHLLTKLGYEAAEPHGTAGAALHRTWIDVMTVVRQRNDQAILNEAERGEAVATTAFADVLEEHPEFAASLVRSIQALAEKVQRAHDRIRTLRESGFYSRRARG